MKTHLLKPFFYGIILSTVFSFIYYFQSQTTDNSKEYSSTSEQAPVSQPTVEEAFPYVIENKTTLSKALTDLEVKPSEVHEIVNAAKPVTDLSRVRAGIRFQIHKDEQNNTTGLQLRLSATDRIDIFKVDQVWKAEKIIEEVEIRTVSFSGIVSFTLWDSAQKAKMDPLLISELADIFAWEVDFSREVRINDRWRLVVEQKFVRGEAIGWGSILAAEYENAGTSYQAVLFRHNGEEIGYFTPEGQSLRKMFLKSPIKYGRITSGFTMRRFHPILKVNRPHLGVDYAAPIGTPIRSVADGKVLFAKFNGGGGNVVRIRHNSSYETVYKHLHGFAKGVRSGAKVKQGQIIGYVGTTGLSTGPHLHYEFYHAGRYVDPLKKKFPSADPVAPHLMADFRNESTNLLTILPSWDKVEVADTEVSPLKFTN